ncbi:FadR family transcriptional regulator [Aeromicrobium sp. YIM 150415]|uniref:FadR/GntR family transcriptional regulator n=1 Tax=Aeromicrobium sp. YIM 150415 TaxID=2803912 RepID=UPI0019636566|nr:FCD domain-containing protein [Aeromicrobium sp. YIM 150415]MBM9461857.1 FadR family transcriptional regulator [Aeromicrobium sp. YIM 150415]
MATASETNTPWNRLGESSLTARIKDEIVRWIEAEGLAPGDRLPAERQMAQNLGVSRPSLREAVRTLQSEGRLVVRHGQGVFVAEPRSAAELRRSLLEATHSSEELFAMREVLEVPAARWAAEGQNLAALQRVERAHDLLLEASQGSPPDFEELQRLDMDFHLKIVQASGNRFLEQTQGVLNSMLAEGMQTTLTVPGRLERSREDHRRILDAILSGDGAAAARAARRHVRGAATAARTLGAPGTG